MSITINSLDITGMKKADFIQLQQIFNHIMEEDIRWDREDYWNSRNERLSKWLNKVVERICDNDIKISDR